VSVSPRMVWRVTSPLLKFGTLVQNLIFRVTELRLLRRVQINRTLGNSQRVASSSIQSSVLEDNCLIKPAEVFILITYGFLDDIMCYDVSIRTLLFNVFFSYT